MNGSVKQAISQNLTQQASNLQRTKSSYSQIWKDRMVAEMLNVDTKLYIASYTKPSKPKLLNKTLSPQTNEHN
ncbi:hypothetical protein Oscil6304_3795 [Oscillatoria acuminata PCC 6304]|uniref:Uncharacterized protein n=1 Tax=Oscillatoria acuminata PCC 6304 TaxID=56110 RepID=K9TLR3_9CYAN|nr:hypothetical protein Oscil6304_3795 [Oscillatoria acuminata PCC 6304]